jgi:hypothetical protein
VIAVILLILPGSDTIKELQGAIGIDKIRNPGDYDEWMEFVESDLPGIIDQMYEFTSPR